MRRAALIIGVLLAPVAAAGQQPPPHGFLDAGAHGSMHPPGETVGGSRGIPTEGIGGTTAGVRLGLSGRMSPRVSIGIEAVLGGRFVDTQQSGIARYRHEYGEHFISFLVRNHSLDTGVGLEGVGGLTLVRTGRTTDTTLVDILGRETGTSREDIRDVRFGATGGVDIVVPIRRFAVVPGLRVTWIPRGEENEFSLGLGPLVVGFGVAARVLF